LPDLQGKLHGIAARVPVPDGSVVDLFAKLGKSVSVEDVHAAVREASESERLRGILQYSETPIVSSDIIGNSHSSVYDSGFTGVTGGRYLRVLNWYDNEWGYSCRVCDLLGRLDAW
jgi:glyceraldehyde 3-phosphate dehydrogenase